jgi:hypothetical protein
MMGGETGEAVTTSVETLVGLKKVEERKNLSEPNFNVNQRGSSGPLFLL